MAIYQITEPALPHLLDLWRSKAVVIGPRAGADGELEPAVLDAEEPPATSAQLPLRSQTHALVALLEDRSPRESVVLFAASPCDAVAVARLRRTRHAAGGLPAIAVVTLACARPRTSCFCTLVEGGPGDDRGADLFARDIGGSLLMEARTAAGEDLLHAGADVLVELRGTEADNAVARATVPHEPPALERADLAVVTGPHEVSEIWAAVDTICLKCEVCSVLCPAAAGAREAPRSRARHWRARLRRMVEPTGDRPVCTGCGRCVVHCPAGIDLRAVLHEQALALEFCDPA